MKRLAIVFGALLLAAGDRPLVSEAAQTPSGQTRSTTSAAPVTPAPEEMDRLLAPVALYPDQLLAQILLCASDPAGVKELEERGLVTAGETDIDLGDTAQATVEAMVAALRGEVGR